MTTSKTAWIKPAIWGFVAGTIVISIVGFNWWGWTLSSTANTQATQRAEKAVASALTPFCIANLTKASDAKQLDALQKLGLYERREAVEKGGWAIMVGEKEPATGVLDSCATALMKIKPK